MASQAQSASSTNGNREGTAKAMVAEKISHVIQSTYNLLHLMQQSSSCQAQLMTLPKNLAAKSSTISNTGKMLEQMPEIISSMSAHAESGEKSVAHLRTVVQVLANMEHTQLAAPRSSSLPPQSG